MEKETATHYKHRMVKPFDPSTCGGEIKKEFEKFIRLYECRYWALDRKAPDNEQDKDAWKQLDMWKQLMGNYVTDRFLDDIHAVSADPRKQTFNVMMEASRTRYAPTQNVTMAHFNFHRIQQKPGQSFDDFVNELKRAEKY